ncbi:MAG: Hsp20/alpha crystallin family protein [Comamonadaceae bacterium]|nr:MAG: Hsp20/alpha crystallin family protein [Comamonadaceae bacterium]
MIGSFGPAADLLSQLQRLRRPFDPSFFPEESSSIRALSGSPFPIINVGSTPDTVEVMALAPGLDPQALELTIDRGLLILAGERQSDLPAGTQRVSTYARERFSGAFRRVVSLPDDVDGSRVDATYRDGILRVTLAKQESSKPRRIEIN